MGACGAKGACASPGEAHTAGGQARQAAAAVKAAGGETRRKAISAPATAARHADDERRCLGDEGAQVASAEGAARGPYAKWAAEHDDEAPDDAASSTCDAGTDVSSLPTLDTETDSDWGSKVQVAPRPDFSGEWLCVRVDGDWDAFLRESGASWATRLAVSSMGYGVGRQTQRISHTERGIHVVNVVKCIPPRESTSSFRTDGVEEEVIDVEGREVVASTSWTGEAMVTKQRSASTREALPTVHRFYIGEEMCTERVAPSGLAVRRFYARAP